VTSPEENSEEDEMVIDVSDSWLFKAGLFAVSGIAAYSLKIVGSRFSEIFAGVKIGPFETITGAIAISVSLGHFIGRSTEEGVKNSLLAYSGFALGLAVITWQSFGSQQFKLVIPALTCFIAFLHLGGVFKEDVKLEGLFSYFDSLNKIVSYGAPGYLAILALKIYGLPMLASLIIPIWESIAPHIPF
jgi:hypothetical protein